MGGLPYFLNKRFRASAMRAGPIFLGSSLPCSALTIVNCRNASGVTKNPAFLSFAGSFLLGIAVGAGSAALGFCPVLCTVNALISLALPISLPVFCALLVRLPQQDVPRSSAMTFESPARLCYSAPALRWRAHH